MAEGGILIKSYSLHHKGDHELDFQPIRDDINVDPEFHGLITLEGRILYFIIKIDNPQGTATGNTVSTTTYHLGAEQTVPFETAFLGRAGLVFVRYDKIVETFLPLS